MDIHALFSLKGKTAVVTGASGALGGAAVRAMAYAGANVAACYNSGRERLDTLISEIGDVGVEIKPYKVNSFSQDEIRQHAEDVMRDFGGIDVVINTAGGNVKLVNLASNIGALVTSLMSGKVFLVLGLIGTVTSFLGHFLGAGLAIKNGSKIVKPAVILVLVLLAAKVIQGLIAG